MWHTHITAEQWIAERRRLVEATAGAPVAPGVLRSVLYGDDDFALARDVLAGRFSPVTHALPVAA